MKKDRIYQNKLKTLAPFSFNAQVAEVFEDMIDRSVPGYQSLQHLCIKLAEYYAKPNSTIYDLGCSSSSTLINIALLEHINSIKLIGVDSSEAMIEKSKQKISNYTLHNEIILEHKDILNYELSNASLVFLNYTLQFIPLSSRIKLLRKTYESLIPGGLLLVSEKITSSNPSIQSFIRHIHQDFKSKNGYSKLEISQKRNALENVLVPISYSDNVDLLLKAGFQIKNIEPIHIYSPFVSIIAVK